MAHSIDPFVSIIYDGLTSPQVFRRHFNLHAAVNKWDDTAKLKYLPIMLIHKAKRVYDGITQKNNIETVLDELDKGCALSKEVALQRFWSAKREAKESLIQYATRLQDLILVAQPGEATNQLPMLQVKLGETLPDAVKIVFSMNTDQTWDGVYKLLERLDPVVPCGPTSGAAVNDSGIIKTEPADVNYTQSNSRNERFPGKCHFCGKGGHKWINCGVRLNSPQVDSSHGYDNRQANNGVSGNNPNGHGNNNNSNNINNSMNYSYNNGYNNSQRPQQHWFGQQQNVQTNQRGNNSYNYRNSSRSSVNSTIGSPLANSTFSCDVSSNNNSVDNSQIEYLQNQNQLLHSQLNEMRTQISRMQASDQSSINSTSQFSQVQVDVHNSADEFPFHSISMSHEAIPAVLQGNSDDLLRINTCITLNTTTFGAVAFNRRWVDPLIY
jgi:hypothetical protein